jgi:hypothetical protein
LSFIYFISASSSSFTGVALEVISTSWNVYSIEISTVILKILKDPASFEGRDPGVSHRDTARYDVLKNTPLTNR